MNYNIKSTLIINEPQQHQHNNSSNKSKVQQVFKNIQKQKSSYYHSPYHNLIRDNDNCDDDDYSSDNKYIRYENQQKQSKHKNFPLSQEFSYYHLCDFIAMKIMKKTKTTSESGFYKFLARFSGRRRSFHTTLHPLASMLFSFLIVISLFCAAESCSSRTTPKPRPPPTPSPRPNITFHTYKCPPTYAKWYCLNEATCFTVKIGDEILYNCECADGYMGPRCEYKDLDGSYLPTRPRVMLETASIASGATLAFIIVLILCLIMYVRWHQHQKLERLRTNGGVDTVDGLMHVVKCSQRPFGPHHYYTIPMAASLKR